MKLKKVLTFLVTSTALVTMVFAGDKVHADPKEYEFKKKASLSDLQSSMGFKSRIVFQKVLAQLGVTTNGSKFTDSQTKTIILDKDQKTIQLKNQTKIYLYDTETGQITLTEDLKPCKPYDSYSKKELEQRLYSAIFNGDLSEVQKILATRKININETFEKGWTPLQLAVNRKKLSIVNCNSESKKIVIEK